MKGVGWGVVGERGGAVRRGGKMTAGQKKCHTADLDQQVLSSADPVACLLPHSFSGLVSCRLPLPF